MTAGLEADMCDDSKRASPAAAVTLTDAALRGSFWLSAQWLLNKMATAGATLVIVYFLSPQAYGIAVTAMAIAAYLRIAPPEVMGQVLLAHTRHIELFAAAGRRLGWGIGAAGTVLTFASIPIVLRIYSGFPRAWLGGLLVVLAGLPLLSGALVVPLTGLQRTLQFRRIAVMEGTLQFAATSLSVAFAAVGGGAASLVVPQVAKEGARALWYRRAEGVRNTRRFRGVAARLLLGDYLMAAAGVYLHGALVGLEVLFLGFLAGEYEAGLFGFGFTLAVQMTRVFTARIGVVLQSTFAKLHDDRGRQVDGLLRAQRVLSAVCIPFALVQVVLATPFFDLVLPDRWSPAVPVFQLLSIVQAFYFASGPSIAGLKAQRRFGLVVIWQGIQTMVAIPVYWWAAAHGAVPTAIASAAMWSVSAPIGTWLCARADGRASIRRTVNVFLRPWLVSGPLFGAGYLVVGWLERWGAAGDVVAVAVVGPTLLLLALAVSWFTDADFRSVAGRGVRWIRESIATR